jgi:hypothetical protein
MLFWINLLSKKNFNKIQIIVFVVILTSLLAACGDRAVANNTTKPSVTPTPLIPTDTPNPTPTLTTVASTPTPTTVAITEPTVPPTTVAITEPTATPEPTATLEPLATPTLLPESDRIIAIGDSVILGSGTELKKLIPGIEIDGKVSRYFQQGIDILQELSNAGELTDEVIIHLGTNGPITAKQFDEMMLYLSGVHRVLIVNLKVPRDWEEFNNEVLSEGVKRYPTTVLVDWHAAASGDPELFGEDGYHPTQTGAKLFARLIKDSL